MTVDTTATLIGEVHELRVENEALKGELRRLRSGSAGTRIDDLLSPEELASLQSDLAGIARARRRGQDAAANWPMHRPGWDRFEDDQ